MRLHVASVLLALAVTRADAQAPKPPIIDLATAYVHRFVDAFSNVVAEERYTQEVPRQRRTLRSDFLLVRYPGATRWQAFRDVLEVDGKRVQEERQDRLAMLFLEPPENALRRIDEIARASARYNLRDIGTLNSPLHVLFILQVDYRDRFRFSVAGLDRSLGPTVRIVRFEESARPTLIRSNFNDRPSRGFVWIDEQTGRIVKTELRIALPTENSFPTTITTLFGFNEELAIDVPLEMRDSYPLDSGDMKGVATYSRFRRFQVNTDTELLK